MDIEMNMATDTDINMDMEMGLGLGHGHIQRHGNMSQYRQHLKELSHKIEMGCWRYGWIEPS